MPRALIWIFTLLLIVATFRGATGQPTRQVSRLESVEEPHDSHALPTVSAKASAQAMNDKPVITAVALHPGGQWMATAGDDHHVLLWNQNTGELAHRMLGHVDWVRSVAFSHDGGQLISAGNDGRIVAWDVELAKPIRTIAVVSTSLAAVACHPTGDDIACVGFDGKLRVYVPGADKAKYVVAGPGEDLRGVVYSPDGRLIAVGGRSGVVRVYQSETGEALQEHQAHRLRIRSLAFSPDGQAIATAGDDRVVRVASVNDLSQGATLPPCGGKVLSLSYVGPSILATGCSDNKIHLWNTDSRTEVDTLEGHTGSIAALAYREQNLVSVGFDATVRAWPIDVPQGAGNHGRVAAEKDAPFGFAPRQVSEPELTPTPAEPRSDEPWIESATLPPPVNTDELQLISP